MPGPGQIAIPVKACGVNFPDVLIIEDKYQFKPPLPFAPGAEIAGVVKALGEGVTRFKIGDRVIASIGNGGMQEEDRWPIRTAASRCPTAWISRPARAFILTYGTSHYALKDRAQAESRRDARGAGRGRRRRPGRGRARQGDGRARDRGRVDARRRSISR